MGASKLGAEEDYFSANMEEFLNRERETPFARLANKAIQFVEGKFNSIKITSDDEEICKKFLTTTMSRSELAFNAMKSSSVTVELFPEQTNHDHLVFFGSTVEGVYSDEYRSHKLIVTANKTDRLFVVPRNCFYIVQSFGFNCITFPISPCCALQLVPPDFTACHIDGEEVRYGIYSNSEDILHMNIAALRYEYVFNKQFVAASRRSELDELLPYLKDHKEELEVIRNSLPA